MKLLVLSDLHLEFANFMPEPNLAEVVVLAGDIGVRASGIQWARKSFPNQEIIYVAGNHEFYGSERCDVIGEIQSECADEGIHFLNDAEVQLRDSKTGKNIRFLGATLWTDFELFGEDLKSKCMSTGAHYLNDFKIIREEGVAFTPKKSIELHEQSLTWIGGELERHFDGKTVIVTHHLPSMYSVSERYKSDLLSACFASDLGGLFGKMDLWVHGHTHDSFDYEVNGSRVVCNPRGYVRSNRIENPNFNPSFMVEI